MSYINRLHLYQYIVKGEKPDAVKLLSAVDRRTIETALIKSKEGLPGDFVFRSGRMEEENYSKLSYRDKFKLAQIFERLKAGAADLTEQLEEYRRRYPNVPLIYNYLGISLRNAKRTDAYVELLHETIDRFPDYLFGKTALAEHYLNVGLHVEIPNVLDKGLEIYHYTPKPRPFHISEVRAFYGIVGRYYAKTGKTARAINCWFVLYDSEPQHLATRVLGDEIMYAEVLKVQKEMRRR